MAQKPEKNRSDNSICCLFAAIPIKIFNQFTSSTGLSNRFMLSINSCHRPIFTTDGFLGFVNNGFLLY